VQFAPKEAGQNGQEGRQQVSKRQDRAICNEEVRPTRQVNDCEGEEMSEGPTCALRFSTDRQQVRG
jgi:hypothetical protein